MSCNGASACNCGCCIGTSAQTPQLRDNLPGPASITYRTGTWASFKESLLARLSSADYPALAALRTREDDDFTIALLDAAAVVLDVLTFYQERLANESYLRTASQLRSLTEMSRLIGYRPSPGFSASAYVAFTLRGAPGQPANPNAPAITIPASTQMQSVPAQGQSPQTFETSADIQAKSDWSALPVLTTQPWIAPEVSGSPYTNSMYLSGTSTQLNPGDALLILGVVRETCDPNAALTGYQTTPRDQWDVVILNQVEVDTVRKLTYVAWDQPLNHETFGRAVQAPRWTTATVFAFRQRASLFGHNAPSPYLFVNLNANPPVLSLSLIEVDSGGAWQWIGYQLSSPSAIDLDATYPKSQSGAGSP